MDVGTFKDTKQDIFRGEEEEGCVCLCAYLVLLVLPGVGEAGNDSGDTRRRGDLAGVDHDQQLHQVVVDLAAAALHDVHVLAAHTLPNLHAIEKRRRKQSILINDVTLNR